MYSVFFFSEEILFYHFNLKHFSHRRTLNYRMRSSYRFVPPQVMDISKWIFTLFNEQWSTWLDDNARGTIDKGGFYTFRGKDGPRIISLNSMFCYNLNW